MRSALTATDYFHLNRFTFIAEVIQNGRLAQG